MAENGGSVDQLEAVVLETTVGLGAEKIGAGDIDPYARPWLAGVVEIVRKLGGQSMLDAQGVPQAQERRPYHV
jgi:hypothetical protein